MTDFSQFLPLFDRSEEDIRADIDARVNAGLTTDDPDWIDTRAPGLFYLATQALCVQAAKLWSALTEMAAAANPGTAWGDYLDTWAESFLLERKAAARATGGVHFTGTNGTIVGSGAQVGVVQTDPDESPPAFVTTQSGTIAGGVLDLTIEAVDAGTAGNVGPGAVTLPLTPLPGVATITNPASTGGGTEPESDVALRERLRLQFTGRGSGTVDDYKRWALELPGTGIGRVTVVPHASGPGTVLVIVSTEDGDPVGTPVVDALKAYLDPTDGLGDGRAPIGHNVTVQTTVAKNITVVATVAFDIGYSLDGASGTIALRDEVEDALRDYINGLDPGEDVILNHVRAVFFEVDGVHDVTALTLNGSAANVVVNTSPTPEVPTLVEPPTLT